MKPRVERNFIVQAFIVSILKYVIVSYIKMHFLKIKFLIEKKITFENEGDVLFQDQESSSQNKCVIEADMSLWGVQRAI